MAGTKNKGSKLDAQALRAFRSDVAKLKRKGIVSKKVDARSQEATRYMRAKVRKFSDVLSGEAIAVRAKKEVREKYTSAEIFQERGSFLIVPKEHKNSRARIKKGRNLVEIITPLAWGEEREVVLPFKATNMMDLATKVQNREAVDDLKKGDEQFAFRLFGNNSRKAFVNREEFADHVLRNYQHLFKGSRGAIAVKHLSVIRFKGNVEDIPEPNPDSDYYESPQRGGPRPFVKGRNRGGPKGSYEKAVDRKLANRKAKARANETAAQRTERLAANAKRSKAWREARKKDK